MGMVPVNHQVTGLDNLVTVTLCGVFILALWKLRRANEADAVDTEPPVVHTVPSDSDLSESSTPPPPELPRNHSCFALRDCFGDVIYGTQFYSTVDNNAAVERSQTPGSVISMEMESIPDHDERWELLDESVE